MGRISEADQTGRESEKKLQAHPVQLLLLEQARPTNLQQGWNSTDLVRQRDFATHDHPGGDGAAAHHTDSTSRDVVRFRTKNFFGLFGGFEGLEENQHNLCRPRDSRRVSPLLNTWIDSLSQSASMLIYDRGPVNHSNGLAQSEAKKERGLQFAAESLAYDSRAR
jgi:hypothetical protein